VCLGIYGRGMNIQIELDTLAQRIRQIREAQGLTLQQVSTRSKGRISAIALGSYERGDRSISAKKILELAEIYAIPVGELFTPSQQGLEAGRVVIDLRKLSATEDPIGKQLLIILKRIVAQRRDWNGEVISLRQEDLVNLQTFAHFSSTELSLALERYALSNANPTKLK
jgi:transcriptional regulator with XRE-family HTH domain